MSARADESGFLAALDRHKALLYKIANAWCQRREDRSDLIQDMVVQLWHAWPSYDGRAVLSTWMYRVALNVAISLHRSESRRIRDGLPIEDFGMDLAAADRVLDAEGDDLRALHQLIARLEPLDRALVLMYLEGHSQDEIAAALGLTPGNVGTRIHRIKDRLQRDYAAAGEDA